MKKIEAKKGIELGIKRFYLPSVLIKLNCTQCNSEMNRDFGSDFLSYPSTGEQKEFIYCEKCDTEHQLTINLNITVEYDKNTLRQY